jgi:hypothetical protein
MLHNWELLEHFTFVHFEHSRVDLFPAWNATDVVQLIRVLVESTGFVLKGGIKKAKLTHVIDELNCFKEEIVKLIDQNLVLLQIVIRRQARSVIWKWSWKCKRMENLLINWELPKMKGQNWKSSNACTPLEPIKDHIESNAENFTCRLHSVIGL